MATAVQIELRVNEAGAVSAVRQFDNAVKQTTADVQQMAAAGNKATASLQTMGQSAPRLIDPLGREWKATGEAAAVAGAKTDKALLSTRDNIKLASAELGVKMPRAMQKVIAQTELMSVAFSALSPVLMGIGAITIGQQMFTQLDEMYRKWLDINAAADEYEATVKQAQKEAFTHPQTEETARMRIQLAAQQSGQAGKQKEQNYNKAEYWRDVSNRTGPLALGIPGAVSLYYGYQARKSAGQEAETHTQFDELNKQYRSLVWGRRKREVELQYADDPAGQAKAMAALEAQRKRSEEGSYGNPIASDAGKKELSLEQRLAERKQRNGASGETTEKQRAAELARMQAEARQADLTGEQLFYQRKEDAYAEFVRKYGASTEARKAFDDKYAAERKKRDEEESRQVALHAKQAESEGLTGVASIQARGDARVLEIQQRTYSKPENQQQEIAIARRETNAEIAALERSFHDQVDQMADQSATRQISGFARIHAEAERELNALQRKFEETYGKLDRNSPEYTKGQADLNRGISAIRKDEFNQNTELAQKAADETQRIEEEAHRKALPIARQRTQELYDEYNDRLRKYQEMLNAQEISETDYNRRVAAAGRDMNAQLQNQARETRDKLAGELENFFSSPQQFFQRMATRAMSQSAANMLMRFQGKSGAWNELDGMPSLFGGFLGGHKLKTASGAVLPGGDQRNPQAPTFASPASVVSIGTATITIGSASVLGGMTNVGGSAGSALSNIPGMAASTAELSGPNAASTATASGATLPGFSGASSAPTFGGVPGAISTVESTLGAAKQMRDVLGAGNKAKAGNAGTSIFGSAKVGSGISAGMGLFGAYESNGGFSGALGGAMSGAKLGMTFGGPIGGVVGAIGGAVLGALGVGGRAKAEKYDKQQVRPRIAEDERNFGEGGMDYLSAYSDLDALGAEAKKTVKQWGGRAEGYYNDTIKKEIQTSQQKLSREAKAGRAQFTMQAAQFHTGGGVSDFGDLWTSPDEGLVHARLGEFIVKPNVTRQNRPTLEALNSGASMESIAAAYRNTMQSGSARQTSGGDRTVNMNFQSLDSKSTARLFMENKHHVRSALNASYSEYSGEADA